MTEHTKSRLFFGGTPTPPESSEATKLPKSTEANATVENGKYHWIQKVSNAIIYVGELVQGIQVILMLLGCIIAGIIWGLVKFFG